MRSLSDSALRRSAWAVALVTVAATATSAVVPLAYPGPTVDRSQSWGGDEGVGAVLFVAVVLAFSLMGLLILLRQPRNTIGWLLQAIGSVWGVTGLVDTYAYYGLVGEPGAVPRPDLAAALTEGTWAVAIGLMGTFLFLLFPDGHLPSARWRPVAWLSAVSMVVVTVAIDLTPGELEESPVPTLTNPLALEAFQRPLEIALFVFLPLLPLLMVASAVALVRRFRSARGGERQQLKWLATAGALVALTYLVTMVASWVSSFSDRSPGWVLSLQSLSILSFVLLPVAIGLAVLRYRLYDIDVVINRALVYSALTVMLGTTYLALVLGLQGLFGPVTEQSDLAVAVSTLAVAALFGPARRRVQTVVDRRFYRNRYDAARTVDAFVSQLRHELDLDAVGACLSAAVRDTVQPAHVSLWLRDVS